ncbi:hypothetical protein NPX13_g474 [Xylaria arbuscula]|uniref:PH domain-containing protein n=1 Tax=Xylaria arbuscula TaxID=114810 RepID=A0A9W8NP84_9PEZI|nr:hypothetical protein NPX13_g474 [Xylaria arbuscula]
MSRPAPRRSQNHQPSPSHPSPNPNPNPNLYLNPNDFPEQQQHQNTHLAHQQGHSHGHGHRRTRSRQLQDESRRQRQPHHHQNQNHQQTHLPRPPPITNPTPPNTWLPNNAAQSAALAGRTNPELNLSVLRRYLPSITLVLSIAANAVVYTFQSGSQWKRTTMEGTMFICSQRKAPGEAGETGCLFILNRKGLQNFVLDLDNVVNFELAGGLLIFKLDYAAHELHLENGEAVAPLVLGIWTHAEEESDRETNATLITDMWAQALSTRDARAQAAASDPATFAALAETGPAAQATRRRLSMSDLFSGYNGNTLPPTQVP